MKYILGIDEAGRGPAIGPMVVCGALVEKDKIPFFKDIGVKDSKKLSIKKREYFSKIIMDELVGFSLTFSWPSEIDEYVYSKSLNLLEAKLMTNIINSFNKNVDFEIIIDSPQKNFIKLISNDISKGFSKIKCEFKADQNYIPVSLASILAKYYRDLAICDLKTVYGDFGSGYPSDVKTQKFLKNYFNEKVSNGLFNNIELNILRKSWNLKILS